MSEVVAYFVGVIILVVVLYYGLQLLGSLLIFNPILGVILWSIVVGFLGYWLLKINFNYFKEGYY